MRVGYVGRMKRARRATVRLDPELHRALREQAVRNYRSVSDLVNYAVRQSLAEAPTTDSEAPRNPIPLHPRPKIPALLFESVLKGLKRRGKT